MKYKFAFKILKRYKPRTLLVIPVLFIIILITFNIFLEYVKSLFCFMNSFITHLGLMIQKIHLSKESKQNFNILHSIETHTHTHTYTNPKTTKVNL